MSTFHVVPRLMVFSKFSGSHFSDEDLEDVGSDNSYKPDKGKGDKLKLPDRSSHCGTCQIKVGVSFEMFIFLQVEEVEVVAEAVTETVAVIWILLMITTV